MYINCEDYLANVCIGLVFFPLMFDFKEKKKDWRVVCLNQ